MFKEEPQDLRENLNVYVMHGSSIAKNLNVSTGGGLSVDFDSLVDMSSLQDVTPIVDNLQALQNLDSPHCSSEADLNSSMPKKARFVEELKIVSKWTNMLDEREYSNFDEDDESVQTIRKLGQGRPKKISTRSSKVEIYEKL